ncbi:MAG TPA: hypothetical protein VFG19_00760, partial [Geobacteraceae bacterium]|nr:hypothetical protein [Geobacteraceae bacterium]
MSVKAIKSDISRPDPNPLATEFTKQIVLAVTDDKIYSYIVFAASILYGESEPMIDNNSLRELLER